MENTSTKLRRPKPHAHFWKRALNRRQLLVGAGGAMAIAMTPGVANSSVARAQGMEPVAPKPIPYGIDPFGDGTIFHLELPGPGADPSSIYDFRGVVAVAHIGGEGTVTEGVGEEATLLSGDTVQVSDRLYFDTDMRFMQGLYVGEDEEVHSGTFGFI